VEYFCGKGQTIFFPWAEGLKVEQMQKQYDATMVKGARFKDWVHAETGMEVLKAQHPEFELWSMGIHARSGVSCADCHMPYKREGAQKISDHWVRSPLLQPNRSCAGCHPLSDDELKARVTGIQDRHFDLMTRTGQANVAMIDAIVAVRRPHDERNRAAATAKAKETLEKQEAFQKAPKEEQEKKLAAEVKANLLAAWRDAIAKDPKLKELEELQRAAQWRLDYVAAENSMGFHAPQETARILGESIDLARQAEVKAAQLGAGTVVAQAGPTVQVIPAAATKVK
jgi:nitrite reductase (cytochrome c-552)